MQYSETQVAIGLSCHFTTMKIRHRDRCNYEANHEIERLSFPVVRVVRYEGSSKVQQDLKNTTFYCRLTSGGTLKSPSRLA